MIDKIFQFTGTQFHFSAILTVRKYAFKYGNSILTGIIEVASRYVLIPI